MLDRLRHLRRDREQQLDLVVGERARLARAHVECAFERAVAREDRHGEDRLVLVLGQVGEVLEPRIEVRLRLEHHRCARRGGRAGDPLAAAACADAASSRRSVCRASRAARARRRARRRGRRSTRPPRAPPATFVATSASTSWRSSVELTASIVSVSSRRCRSRASIRAQRYARPVDKTQWLLMLHIAAAFLPRRRLDHRRAS